MSIQSQLRMKCIIRMGELCRWRVQQCRACVFFIRGVSPPERCEVHLNWVVPLISDGAEEVSVRLTLSRVCMMGKLCEGLLSAADDYTFGVQSCSRWWGNVSNQCNNEEHKCVGQELQVVPLPVHGTKFNSSNGVCPPSKSVFPLYGHEVQFRLCCQLVVRNQCGYHYQR